MLPFQIDETPNLTGNNFLDRDFITFPSFPFSVTSGNLELQLLGFRDPQGNTLPSFESPEDGTNSVELVGRIRFVGVNPVGILFSGDANLAQPTGRRHRHSAEL